MRRRLEGRWLTNAQAVVFEGLRLGHFVEDGVDESYCSLISVYALSADIQPDRACMRCVLFLLRDGHLHIREPLPGSGVYRTDQADIVSQPRKDTA